MWWPHGSYLCKHAGDHSVTTETCSSLVWICVVWRPESLMELSARCTVRKCPIRIKISDFFVVCDLEILRMTLKNNRASLLCYFKLCASFHSHRWIQTGVTVWKRPIRIKMGDFFLLPVTLKFDGWLWKTIGYLFYATSSFVHHFIAISEFILELQSGNTQFGSKLAIFCPVWPWNLMDDLDKQ